MKRSCPRGGFESLAGTERAVGRGGGQERGEQEGIAWRARLEAGLWVSPESVYPRLLSIRLQFQAFLSFLVFCNLKEQRKDQD